MREKINGVSKVSKTINSKDYFCINCFEDKNIKDFIKSNGSLVADGTFKCGFCQVLDWTHYEKYNIKEYSRKLFKSSEIYTIPQKVLNKKIIEIINEHFEYVESPKYNEQSKLMNLVEILSEKLFSGKSTDVLIKLAKYNFIEFREFPFKESCHKTYIFRYKDMKIAITKI